MQSLQGHSVHSQCFTFDSNRLTLGNDFKSAGTRDISWVLSWRFLLYCQLGTKCYYHQRIYLKMFFLGIKTNHLKRSLESSGPKMDPCVTTAFISVQELLLLLTFVLWKRPVRLFSICFRTVGWRPYALSLARKSMI